MISQTPQPPYYAVIFTSVRTDISEGYEEMAEKMVRLASKQEGFLGLEAARNELGISISYWSNLAAIKKWKENTEHVLAQEKGKALWYESFKTRICKVEREYGFGK